MRNEEGGGVEESRGAHLCLKWLVRNVDGGPEGCGAQVLNCAERLTKHFYSAYIPLAQGSLF